MRSYGRLRRSSKSPKWRGSRRRRRLSGLWPQRKRVTVIEETPQNESNSHPPIRFVFTYRLYVSTIRPAGYPPYPRGLRVDGTQKPLTRQSRKDARGLSNPAWLGNGARCKRQDLLLPTGDARLRTSRLQKEALETEERTVLALVRRATVGGRSTPIPIPSGTGACSSHPQRSRADLQRLRTDPRRSSRRGDLPGNQHSEWKAGCRFDHPNPEHR